jgi:hypothetical protein
MKKPKLAHGFAQKEVDRLDAEFTAKEQEAQKLLETNKDLLPVQETAPEKFMPNPDSLKKNIPRISPTWSKPANGKKKPEQDSLRRKAWEYVEVICAHNEISGETLEFWLKPMIAGEDCNFWQVPVNRVVMIPRHVAEHIKTRKYARLMMQEEMTVERQGPYEFKGKMTYSHTVQRLDCTSASGF